MIHKLRTHAIFTFALFAAFVSTLPTFVAAQTSKRATATQQVKLPSPERIIADYHRAVGGKKRLAGVRDAIYEWEIVSDEADGVRGRGKLVTRAPGSTRWTLDYSAPDEYSGIATKSATTLRSAWMLARNKPRPDASREATPASSIASSVKTENNYSELSTLTGAEASTARALSSIFASRLVDYKKQSLLARTSGTESADGEVAYAIELTSRDGARLRLLFGQTSKLLLRAVAQSEDGANTTTIGDYRPENGILEPHRIAFAVGGVESVRLVLRSVRRNTGVADAAFDPPGGSAIDVPQLLRGVARNQQILDERISEYTFTRKSTRLTINDRGETTKREIETHEVYPVSGGGRVIKLIAENDVPLAGERLAREERRVTKEIEETERDNARRAERKKRGERNAEQKNGGESGLGRDGDDDLGVGTFLRACEFVAPRRERFRERDVVVFDFRPRAGFKPANRGESLLGKLTGIVWIDPADKQVMRLEARLADGFKVGGGLLASVRQGSAFVVEQARMPDGVWLPRFSQINAGVKVFLLAGLRLDATREYSDYKRFAAESKDYELKEQK